MILFFQFQSAVVQAGLCKQIQGQLKRPLKFVNVLKCRWLWGRWKNLCADWPLYMGDVHAVCLDDNMSYGLHKNTSSSHVTKLLFLWSLLDYLIYNFASILYNGQVSQSRLKWSLVKKMKNMGLCLNIINVLKKFKCISQRTQLIIKKQSKMLCCQKGNY